MSIQAIDLKRKILMPLRLPFHARGARSAEVWLGIANKVVCGIAI